MRRTSLTLALGTTALLLGSGCKVTYLPGADTYETCFSTSDCGSSRDSCVDFPSTSGSLAACSHSCRDDGDCEFGGRCLSFDDGLRFFCVQSCTSSSQCEIGWSCNDFDADANACLPGTAVTPTQATYDSCTASTDCINTIDECFAYSTDTGNVASCTHDCGTDADCAGGRCLSLDSGTSYQCMQNCTSDASCETGWSCNTIDAGSPACLPGLPPAGIEAYNECPYNTPPDECLAGTACWGITVDGVMAGVCSDGCATDADCPLDSRGNLGSCLAFPGQPALCFESCNVQADCAPGWACKNSANGISFPNICVPI